MRIPIHGANDGKIVTPHNANNIGEEPVACFGDKGYFLPCNCLDLCKFIKANGDTMEGLKFEVAVVPSRAKASSIYFENLSMCPGVELKVTYEDMLGAEIEAIAPAAAITFADDPCTTDTSHLFHFDKAGEAGYVTRSDTGIFVIEVVADPENTLVSTCCEGTGTCAQPMFRWGVKYDGANVMRWVLADDCLGKMRDLTCLDCPTEDQVTAFEASDRYTELAQARSMGMG